MSESPKQVPLHELNAQLFRSVHPHAFGSDDDKAIYETVEAKEDAEIKKFRELRAHQEATNNGILARHLAQLQEAQGVQRVPTAEEQAALDLLAAMNATPPPAPTAEEQAAPSTPKKGK